MSGSRSGWDAAGTAHCADPSSSRYTGDAAPLFEAAGLSRLMDDGFVSLDEITAAEFISRCAKLRFWSRQLSARAGSSRLVDGC